MSEAEASNSASELSSSGSDRKRPSILAVAGETIQFIEKAEKDKSLNVRTNDRRSAIFALLSFAVGIVFLVLYMVNPGYKQLCIALALVSDALFGMSILWYVLLRFGVLRSVEPRHALLCWQLMLGAGALFAFYTMNIAFGFFTIYTTSVATPVLPQ